jgi:hypothetical protein
MALNATNLALSLTSHLLAMAIERNDGQVTALLLIEAQRDAQTLPMLDGVDWDEVRHEIARRMCYTVGKQGSSWFYAKK